MISIGVDVGGTSIKGAAVNEKGEILGRFKMPTELDPKGIHTVNSLIALIKTFIYDNHFEKDIVGIGLGIPGCIDVDRGIVCSSANLKWENLAIADMFKNAFPYPIRITNDANAAALGEAKFGGGKNYNSSIMVTLGTGIGGGVVIDGKLFEGNEGKGTELGHMVIDVNGRTCGCGRKGCLEAYASATGLIRSTKSAMDAHPSSLMHKIAKELGGIDGRVAFRACQAGDPAGIEVIDKYIYYLSEGLLNFCNIFRPNVIILSGGIANVGQYLIDRVNTYLEEHDYGYKNAPAVPVVLGELGYDSGIIGAASLWL